MLALLALLATCASATVLQISARGMACAEWHGGGGLPPGIGQDCVDHQAVGSSSPLGGPWWGAVDLNTGVCTAIPGVTEFFDNVLEVHDNLVPTKPGHALGYAFLNETSGPFAVAVTLPTGTHTSGSVKLRDRVKDSDWPPAWSESDGPNRVVAWTYVEFHSTGAAAVAVNELLQVLDSEDGSVLRTLGNVSTEFPDGIMGPPHYGFGHAVDASKGVLFTQSENQSVQVLDLAKNKSLPALAGTSGKQLMCMYYDSLAKKLGGIVSTTSAGMSCFQLVSVDTTTGAMRYVSQPWSTKQWLGGLELFHHDDKPERFPPECTFDQSTGTLAMLLFQRDPEAIPGWDHTQLYVSTLYVRDGEESYPSQPLKLTLPFHSPKPLGKRTWRALEPSISWL